MKIKTKLIISFCIIILVPVILFSLISGAIYAQQIRELTNLAKENLQARQMFNTLVLYIVCILVFTAVLLLLWVYRSIITPIRKLRNAADNIKEGNLDFCVDVSGADEIGELGEAFESMRRQLKDNAEEKLRDEQESRALISNIAHDLKTPITAVKGYAEGILDGVANTPEKVDKYVRTIYNKATEMNTLINELTLYSKIDTNRIPYNFAKIHVADYFNDCIKKSEWIWNRAQSRCPITIM